MTLDDTPLVNWAAFGETRAALGADFVRILGYFREDGIKSVKAIEEAMRAQNSAQLVIPAHTLKGEAYQFGAERLAALAEHIEISARRFVEYHQTPDELIKDVVTLRPLFEESLALLEKEVNPLVERRSFGRRPVAPGGFGTARGFGRA